MSWRYMTTFTESKYEDVDGYWSIREWYDATGSHGEGFTAIDIDPYGDTPLSGRSTGVAGVRTVPGGVGLRGPDEIRRW